MRITTLILATAIAAVGFAFPAANATHYDDTCGMSNNHPWSCTLDCKKNAELSMVVIFHTASAPPITVTLSCGGQQFSVTCYDYQQECHGGGGIYALYDDALGGCSASRQWDGTWGNSCRAWMPQCSDGHDNDGNGKVDYPQDGGCSSATDGTESTPPPPPPPPPQPDPCDDGGWPRPMTGDVPDRFIPAVDALREVYTVNVLVCPP